MGHSKERGADSEEWMSHSGEWMSYPRERTAHSEERMTYPREWTVHSEEWMSHSWEWMTHSWAIPTHFRARKRRHHMRRAGFEPSITDWPVSVPRLVASGAAASVQRASNPPSYAEHARLLPS